MKSKSLILLVLSIGFGVVAAVGISQVMKGQAQAGPSEAPRGPVLLAAADLDLHAKLSEENVKLENWLVDTIPPDAVTSLEQITDMVTTTRMSPGLPIVLSAIQHKNLSTRPAIPPNMKVVAVRVSADDTIGNLLNPGNKVDVIGVFKQRDPNTNQVTTNSRTFLKALKVYSIGNKTTNDSAEKGNTNQNASSIVGLMVTEKQSEALVFVQDAGSIKLVLRGDDEVNSGEVEQIDKLKDELLAGGPSPAAPQKAPMKTIMEIFRGSESSTTEFDTSGSRVRTNNSQGYEDTEGDFNSEYDGGESSGGGYGDSSDRGDIDRGIDDDQYQDE